MQKAFSQHPHHADAYSTNRTDFKAVCSFDIHSRVPQVQSCRLTGPPTGSTSQLRPTQSWMQTTAMPKTSLATSFTVLYRVRQCASCLSIGSMKPMHSGNQE